MPNTLRPLALLTLLAAAVLAASPALAQQVAAERPLPVAVLRLDKVLKENKSLQDQLAPLKEEATELEQKSQLRQVEIETTQSQLRKAQPGSAEFQKLQVQLLRLTNELQQFVARERQQIQQKEGQIYLAVYHAIEEEVKRYSQAHGIKLVLRHQEAAEGDQQSAQAVLASLNRGIIYQEDLDITDEIIAAIQKREE